MSTLETNSIGKYSGNNVSIDDALNLKSYDTAGRDALTSVAGDMIYNSDDNKVQAYTGSAWEDLGGADVFEVDFVVVGGGGKSGGGYAGGAGAGGVLSSVDQSGGTTNTPEDSAYLQKSVNYLVTVGAGSTNPYALGSASEFAYITAAGGGGAIGGNGSRGLGGASGGGGCYGNGGQQGYGQSTQGNDGGSGSTQVSSQRAAGGGGGGAGAAGSPSTNYDNGGNGGIGVYCNILSTTQATTASVGEVDGSNVYFGGGAGGSIGQLSTGSPGSGGLGGGGDGNTSGGSNNGTANTGGGGGNGGSGVVIIKYPDTVTMGGGTGLTIHTPSNPPTGYTLKVFTGGTGTVSFS